jgi:SPP1 family holin
MKSNKINAGTIARTICLALALVNQFLTMSGHSMINIDDETITEFISLGFTIVASICAWWKNNSFTETAIEADRYLEDLKKTKEALIAREEGEADDN